MTYTPGQAPLDIDPKTAEWVHRELSKIREELNKIHDFDIKHGPPKNYLQEALLRYADGTDWNPGGGKGLFLYYDDRWHRLKTQDDINIVIPAGNLTLTTTAPTVA